MQRYGPGGRFDRRDLDQYGREVQSQQYRDEHRDEGQVQVKAGDITDRDRDEDRYNRDKRDFGQYRNLSLIKPYHSRPRNPPVGQGIYMFIRFPGSSVEFAAQTVVLGKRCVLSYRGEFVGIARKIHELSSSDSREEESLVMYLFESQHGAERFFVSDPRFKQHDFPPPAGACEAWTCVKMRDTQDEEFTNFRAYMLCYTNLMGPRFYEYREQVNKPLGRLIEEHGGIPFVVQNVGVNSLRRHHCEEDTMVTLHFFKDEMDIYNMMKSPKYQEIKIKQFSMAKDHTTVFTIDREACP